MHFYFRSTFTIWNALLPVDVCVCVPRGAHTRERRECISFPILYNAVISLEWHQTSFRRTIMSLEQCPVMNVKRMVQSASNERGLDKFIHLYIYSISFSVRTTVMMMVCNSAIDAMCNENVYWMRLFFFVAAAVIVKCFCHVPIVQP